MRNGPERGRFAFAASRQWRFDPFLPCFLPCLSFSEVFFAAFLFAGFLFAGFLSASGGAFRALPAGFGAFATGLAAFLEGVVPTVFSLLTGFAGADAGFFAEEALF